MTATVSTPDIGSHQNDDSGSILEVGNLTVEFETPTGLLRAVDGVSFDLQSGRTLGIVGESGSGKSVLSRAIMGILPRSARVSESSEIRFEGKRVHPNPEIDVSGLWGAKISMIFQDPMTALTPVMTVGQQLTETLRQHLPLSKKEADRRAVELLQQVGISEPAYRVKQYPHQLSGGMRQRVMIALALSCAPKLVVADEPTTALDVTVQHQILNLLGSLQKSDGMAMILVTHDLGVVAGRTDDTMVMYAGTVVERAETANLFGNMRHPYTQALLNSLPRLEYPSHTRLDAIPGLPPRVVDPEPGCRFAPRCPNAQARCLTEAPQPQQGPTAEHTFSCFYPVGTPEGRAAHDDNLRAGRTAAGLEVGKGVPE
ncbi:ABC transporter ATP-binding protein [Rhodococcus chondri]|uniref:ABC transporter ATP-binding protein n=1 Tax=Rhodococcus chondri TaxID=3065941 RepID=A0ABU7JYM3_9NOCA|nr:ABC transporter ATP-binding protein [Rhodococcus sp. CC-R104]MEE2035019.1 ABC transporter ATP-binding protein [Rhodococcus sp. CC-R104]